MSWKNTIRKWNYSDYGVGKPTPPEDNSDSGDAGELQANRTQMYEDNIIELLDKLADQLEYYYKSSGKEFGGDWKRHIIELLEDISEKRAQASHEYRYDL